jgi:hypothetical protein
MIILQPGSRLEQREGLVDQLMEIGKSSPFSFELVVIDYPSALNRNALGERLNLAVDGRIELRLIEVENDNPSGLVGETNKALSRASQAMLDAIIVGPEALLNRDVILELCAVGRQDPMVGFVEAATTGEFETVPKHCVESGPSTFTAKRVFGELPRLSYVPIVEGPLVLIKSRMLQEFGLLDPTFSSLASALNDFALRANRCGYRVVRANHARAVTASLSSGEWERGERAMGESDEKLLRVRYPYLTEEIERYRKSPDGKARQLLAGLHPGVDGRLKIVFACNYLGKTHNGTSELAKRVITEFSLNHSREYDIYLLCDREAFEFHNYGALNGLTHLSKSSFEGDQPFFASIRLIQPFDDEDIAFLANLAPVTMVLILDTIALDCMQIAPHSARVTDRMIRSTSVLGFISDFSRTQFARRFSREGDHLAITALCSTDLKEYGADDHAGTTRDDGYVLLAGNSLDHKFLKASCEIFRRESPETKLVVLGLQMPDDDQISSYDGGQLSDDTVADLYARASLILFPSHYEGFGLPILHGLAHRKPVVARDLPVSREIRERVREARNLHLFGTTVEMVRFAVTRPAWDPGEIEPEYPVQRWADMAKAMRDALVEGGDRLTYRGLHDRLLEAEACGEIAQQASELAEIKSMFGPLIEPTDMPARAARFISQRFEGRIRSLLAHRQFYTLARSAWGVVKTILR